MSASSNRSLIGKAWLSLLQRGPVGLGRDIRDYLHWQMNRGGKQEAYQAAEPLSNWDLNQRELQSLPDTLRSKPILVYAEASTRCNLHCFICRLSFPETTRPVRQHMTLETFAKLEPLLEPGSRLSLFGLGEPLMNPRFVEMMRIAKERGAFVGLNSNAMLLNENVARAMVELEQDLLMISFSGGTKETYERVITGANYERVIANLRRLNKIKQEAQGNRKQATGSRQQEAGNRQQEAGNRKQATGNRQQEAGNRHQASSIRTEHQVQDSGFRTQDSGLAIERVKPVLELQYTVMRDNLDEIPDAVRLAIDLRCAGMVAMPLTVVNPSLEEQSILKPELRSQTKAVFEDARKVAATAPYPFELQLPVISDQATGIGQQATGIGHQATGIGQQGTGNRQQGTGNGQQGTGNGQQGTGIGQQGTGIRQQGTGNREQATGNREQATGNREQATGIGHQATGIGHQDSEPGTQNPEKGSGLRTRDSGPICYEPWQTFYVRDDGTVNSCCYSNRVLGDLKEQSALEIWNGELYRKFRARMRSDNKPAECRVCHKICGGDWYDQRVDEEQFYDEL